MPRFCIICGAPANSREHIFPAALGGLRVNRGIYCEKHNNGFSRLADILSQQLGVWNALLGVRDRKRRPREVRIETTEGKDVLITTGRVRHLEETNSDQDKDIEFQLTIGGPHGLAAIAYVALTFFAHYFDRHARQSGLYPIKSFIEGNCENRFVWWESDVTTRNLPINPFAFGHTIIMTTSSATGESYALVSMFQTLTFGIYLGKVYDTHDSTVTVFIDPHANRQPVDTQETKSNTIEFFIEPPNPMHINLERMIYQGHGQELMRGLMARIDRWHFDNEFRPTLILLSNTAGMTRNARIEKLKTIMLSESKRIYRLMRYVVRTFREQMINQAHMKPVLDVMSAQISLNDTCDNLSNEAEPFFMRVMAAFIVEVNMKIEREPIDLDYFYDLFNKSPGIDLTARAMIDPIMKFISDEKIGLIIEHY